MPLSGYKVLDFTSNLPGPYCSMVLADLGAEVIKIENPAGGDAARAFMQPGQGDSPYFLAVNRSKRSMALNLKDPAAKEIINRLTRQGYDIWLEGSRPGVMARLGLDYNTMSAKFPALIYAAISGYGQNGPYDQRAGHDAGYLGRSGLLHASGPPGGPPSLNAVQIADLAGGALPAVIGILAACVERSRTGQGRMVDVSMFDSLFSLGCFAMSGTTNHRESAETGGFLLGGRCPCYRIYETVDARYVVVAALEPHFWKKFVDAVDRPDLVPRQFDPTAINEVAKIIAAHNLDYWMEFADRVDCCLDPVLTLAEAEASEQVRDHKLVFDLQDPLRGPIRQAAPLLRTMGPNQPAPPPTLGQHTGEILSNLDYSPNEITTLAERGAIKIGG